MNIRAAVATACARIGTWIAGTAAPTPIEQAPAAAPAQQASEEQQARPPAPEPPRFHGYPYLITPLSPGVFHLMALPSDWPDEMLIDLARAQVSANQLKSCLALGPDRAVYIGLHGSAQVWPKVPVSAVVETGALQPPVAFEKTDDLAAREEWLARFVQYLQARHGRGYGDEVRGGVPASAEERVELEGVNADGSPRGLQACAVCGELRGVCLDAIPHVDPHRIAVHCRCENDNRCARCGQHLFERRLDANYYSVSNGLILYVPGGYARRHMCPLTVQGTSPLERVVQSRTA